MVAVKHAATRRPPDTTTASAPAQTVKPNRGTNTRSIAMAHLTPAEIMHDLLECPVMARCEDEEGKKPVIVYLKASALTELWDNHELKISERNARALMHRLMSVLNDIAEYRDNKPYIECANWRCHNEVDDEGDYCCHCEDAGKGTPAFGPIR